MSPSDLFILIWIYCYCHSQLTAYTCTAIYENWIDDYSNGLQGWTLSKPANNENITTLMIMNDTISTDINTNISYHGPYTGTGSNYHYYFLSRQFCCQQHSYLNISYSVTFCNTLNQTNYVKLYINDTLLYHNNNTNMIKHSLFHDNCTQSFVPITYIKNTQLFELKFEIKINRDSNETITINDIEIDCIPILFLFVIKISITFEYEIIDRDITLHDIENIFINTTQSLLHKYEGYCMNYKDYNIIVKNYHSFANITVNIFVCSMEKQQLLIIDLNDNFANDFVSKLIKLQNDNVVTVDLDTINIEVFGGNDLNNSDEFGSTLSLHESVETRQDDSLWIILYPVLTVLLLCIATCCIYFKCKTKQNKQSIKRKRMKNVKNLNVAHMETINENDYEDTDCEEVGHGDSAEKNLIIKAEQKEESDTNNNNNNGEILNEETIEECESVQ